jgi:hypothetical protein
MAATRKGIVYTLTDPRDGAIRYVGKTINQPLERLAQHLSAPTNPAMRVWFTSLGNQGLLPRMDTIATAPGDKLLAEEARLIKNHAKDGHRLLNAPYYRANLADLADSKQPVTRPPSRSSASPFELSVNALRYRLYGRIAEARAAEALPSYAAAFRSLLLAPLLVVGTLFLLAVQTRAGRLCTLAAMLSYYAWGIGFDHAARDLVLTHLPVAAASSFWHEYLAHPLGQLALHVSIGCVLVAWASYAGVAEAAKKTRQPRAKSAAGSVDIAAAAAAALDGAVLHGVQPSPLVAELSTPRKR